MIAWILVIALACLLLYLYFRFFKLYKVKNIAFVDGSLGTGKSYYSVSLAIRLFRRQTRRAKLARLLGRALGVFAMIPTMKPLVQRLQNTEMPILYSNIRLRCIEFTKVTKDLLFRRNFRFAYGSVLLLDEFSLMADQFCYKDREISERLSEFFKLYRHESNGYIVINSQSTSDMHYSLKYVLSDYLYIHHRTKVPFFTILKVQEMAYSADRDGTHVVNAKATDVEDTLKTMLVSNKYYKYYDSRCYSIFTDGLPVYCNAEYNKRGSYIKDVNLISFKEYTYLMENIERERKAKDEVKA